MQIDFNLECATVGHTAKPCEGLSSPMVQLQALTSPKESSDGITTTMYRPPRAHHDAGQYLSFSLTDAQVAIIKRTTGNP